MAEYSLLLRKLHKLSFSDVEVFRLGAYGRAEPVDNVIKTAADGQTDTHMYGSVAGQTPTSSGRRD